MSAPKLTAAQRAALSQVSVARFGRYRIGERVAFRQCVKLGLLAIRKDTLVTSWAPKHAHYLTDAGRAALAQSGGES